MFWKKKRFSLEIATELLKKIKLLNIGIGETIPSHSSLSKELKISLPSLREGIQVLYDLGYLEIRHGKGTILTQPSISNYYKLLTTIDPEIAFKGNDISSTIKLFMYFILQEKISSKVIKKIENINKKIKAKNNSDLFIAFLKEYFLQFSNISKNVFVNNLMIFSIDSFFMQIEGNIISDEIKIRIIQKIDIVIDKLKSSDKSAVIEEHNIILFLLEPQKKEVVVSYNSFGTGSLGGSFYSVGNNLCNLLEKIGAMKINPEPSGGGIDNVTLAEEGKIVLGITQIDVVHNALQGNGLFNKKYQHISLICELFKLKLWIIVKKNGNLKSINDFKGSRIALGTVGGDSSFIAKKILEIHEIYEGNYVPYYLTISNALTALQQNEIDAVFYLDRGSSTDFLRLCDDDIIDFISIEETFLTELLKILNIGRKQK